MLAKCEIAVPHSFLTGMQNNLGETLLFSNKDNKKSCHPIQYQCSQVFNHLCWKHVYIKTCAWMFIEALFVVDKKGNDQVLF